MRIIPNTTFIRNLVTRRTWFVLAGAVAGGVALSLTAAVVIMISHQGRIFPGVRIGPVPVGGKTRQEALEALALAVRSYRSHWPQTFYYNNSPIAVSLSDTMVRYDLETAISQAYSTGRSLNIQTLPTLFRLLRQGVSVPVPVAIEETWLASESARIAHEFDEPVIEPRLEVVKTATGTAVLLKEGRNGEIFDQDQWQQRIKQSLASLQLPDTSLEIVEKTPQVTPDQQNLAYKQAKMLLDRQLILFVPEPIAADQRWTLYGPDLVAFLDLAQHYNQTLITEYVTGVAESVNRPAKDAKFKFDEASSKVTEFVPAETGITVDINKTVKILTESLDGIGNGEEVGPVEVVIRTADPDVSLSEVNRLGIKERIGVGRSTFKGSIASRVHNVALAASRINGTLIKPGEVFSFNAAVGDISAATGYQAAYIIRNGKTELGDGGGVCQDSTTVFRAALDAGLPITERRGHAYRVGYYEQDAKPGIDATVYSPSTDFKFLNDTPGHILIQTEVDEANRALAVYFYGTSDGRKATISDHVIWDVTPPPPDVYIDDPTLNIGAVKQIDWKAPGTKARFTYKVERDGAVLWEKTFTTVYKPWAAIYLKGTKQ